MTERAELVRWAQLPERNLRRLEQRFGVSEKTAYKWLGRARAEGSLEDQSRRPHTSPHQTPAVIEAQLMGVAPLHPAELLRGAMQVRLRRPRTSAAR